MALLAGPYLASAALLAAGGAAKVLRPAPTARALAEMGVKAHPTLVRTGAGAELAIAAGALAGAGRPVAALVAASYLAFAAFVALALRRGVPLSSCGCFGVQDTPPTALHLALNLAAAGTAAAVALTGAGAGGLPALVGTPLVRVTFLAATAAATWLTYITLTLLPKVRRTTP